MTGSYFLRKIGYDTNEGNNILLYYYLGSNNSYVTHEDIDRLKENLRDGSKIFDDFYIWGKICYRPDYVWLIDVKDLDNDKYFIFLRDEKGEALLDEEKSLIYDVNAMETYWKNYIKIPYEKFFRICHAWLTFMSMNKKG